MAGTGDLTEIPHGKAFYSVAVVFAFLVASLFTAEVFTAGASVTLRAIQAGIAIVYISATAQFFDRLFRSERARKRTSALSPSIRRKLRATRTVVTVLWYAGFFGSAILHFSTDQKIKDWGTDALELSGVFVFLALLLADFSGERWPLKNAG